MLTYFLLFLVTYFLIRFVFGFVIPVVRGAIKVKRQMREMQQHMNGYNPGNADSSAAGFSSNTSTTSEYTSPKPSKGDYIEFEEIK